MKNIFMVLGLMLASVFPSFAQVRSVTSGKIFMDQGLGFDIPVLELSTGIEAPIHNRFEVDGSVGIARAHKQITNSGIDASAGVSGIFWTNSWFGLTGGLGYSRLWTVNENKGQFSPAPGVVFRAYPLSLPSRLSLDYALPTGGIAKDGTESSRLQGVEFKWQTIMSPHVRMTIYAAGYHGLNQGPVYCYPVCKRTGYMTGNTGFSVEFVFPGQDDTKVW